MKKRQDPQKAILGETLLRQISADIPTTIAELGILLPVLRSFGVQAVYEHLSHGEVSPESCIKSASRSLDLMAFHGDKWLFERWFEDELQRLRKRRGQVRFLLADSVDARSKDRCVELMAACNAFEVRLSESVGVFRAVFIDDSRLLLGHYGYEVIEKDGTNAKGWKSPQLLIEDNQQWSLLIPFRALFRSEWERATQLPRSVSRSIKRDFQPASDTK